MPTRQGAAILTLAIFFLSGCAIGRVGSDGELSGMAVGRARLEYCEPPPAATPCACNEPRRRSAPRACRRIAGGSLSGGFADALDAAIAAIAAYFGMGS